MKISDLINELISEAKSEGHARALYNHGGIAFHTVEGRKQMLNHAAIVEKVKAEILHELNGGK